ncbi:hypothetical protein NMG60_11005269 [Bertholletia excelsa]
MGVRSMWVVKLVLLYLITSPASADPPLCDTAVANALNLFLANCLAFLEGDGPSTPSSKCCAGSKPAAYIIAEVPKEAKPLCLCLKNDLDGYAIRSDRAKAIKPACNLPAEIPADPNVSC